MKEVRFESRPERMNRVGFHYAPGHGDIVGRGDISEGLQATLLCLTVIGPRNIKKEPHCTWPGSSELHFVNRSFSQFLGWGYSAVGRALDRHVADIGLIPRCSKGFFSQGQLAMQTLLWCLYTPSVQAHALSSMRMLKIP